MIRKTLYKCSSCGATKIIIDNLTRTGSRHFQDIPPSVPCGYRGCSNRATRIVVQ